MNKTSILLAWSLLILNGYRNTTTQGELPVQEEAPTEEVYEQKDESTNT